ncbi:DNA recombination protein RmuC [Sandaracinobacteroides hominis]|uniref:DNA recombination protein RmuC n=1 Tax=Sandaracinobacteroides hominis TaxID=2780086 RepID=UPI0018F6BB97|nr:DNA recombination protein RmuC [Sandaracinobacteroides hominis]
MDLLTIVLILLVAAIGLLLFVAVRQGRPAAFPVDAMARLQAIETQLTIASKQGSEEARAAREEMRQQSQAHADGLDRQLQAFAARFNELLNSQSTGFGTMRSEAADGRQKLEEALRVSSDGFAKSQSERLGETNQLMGSLADRLTGAQKELREAQTSGLNDAIAAIRTLLEQNGAQHEALRTAVADSLDKVRNDNSEKLEQMRLTVDEKLQWTLEKRLGESFQQVSDRLEQVHRGLGEMQNLATGVGDLKRLMGNVKSRGGWGEAQLEMLLQDILTPEQYSANVRIRPDSTEIVEFAVKMPGKGVSDAPLWLPIDAKLPKEDYERLLAAQDAGLTDEIEAASAALDRFIRQQARVICEKYVHPPYSTDFAVMHLPTEGLFAEVIRRPGLVSELQNNYRVMVTGPTTLAALLTSLQMGFRTLAIEKRSSEVWQILAAAKAEFQKYGDVWEKLGKQLDTAKRTVDDAGRRTRAVSRRLRDVDVLSIQSTSPVLEAFAPDDADETDGDEAEAAE